MRMAVMASNTITFSDSSYRPLQYSDVVYLATRGGALLTGRLDTPNLRSRFCRRQLSYAIKTQLKAPQ